MEVEENRKRKLFNALYHGSISPEHHISENALHGPGKTAEEKVLKLRELLSPKRVRYDTSNSGGANNLISSEKSNEEIAVCSNSGVSKIKIHQSDLVENVNHSTGCSSSFKTNTKNHECIPEGHKAVNDKYKVSSCMPYQSYSKHMEQSSKEPQNFNNKASVPNGIDKMKKKSNSSNGKIPLAYDTNISLLKLAYKLKLAREKLKNRIAKKSHEKLDNIKSNSTQGTANNNNQLSITHQNELTKTAMCSHTKDKSLSDIKSKAGNFFNEIKPIKLPRLPKPAIDVLTSLKIDDDNQKDEIPPKCNSLPLWPILGASREGASRMDTSFLDKYIAEPAICNHDVLTTTRSGRHVIVPMKAIHNDKKEELVDDDDFPTIPEPLMEKECKVVEKIAVSSVLMANLPKIAKKAYDITKLTLDASRRAVLLSVGQKAKPDSKSSDNNFKAMTASFKCAKESNVNNPSELPNLSSSSDVLANSPYTVSLLKSVTSNPCDDNVSLGAVDLSVHNSSVSDNTMLQIKDVNSETNTVEFFSTDDITKTSSNIVEPGVPSNTSDRKEIIDEQRVKSEINSMSYVMNKSSIPRKYQCVQCNYQTDNRSHLRRHESSVHSGDKMYCCYVCKKEFARSEKCRAHIIKQHPGVGYDARFIRKDKYQSRPISSSPLKRSPVPDKKEKSLSPSITPVITKERTEAALDHSGVATSSDIKETSSLDGNEFPTSQATSPPEEELPLNLSSDVIALSPKTPVQDSPNKMYRCQICFYVGRDGWHLKRHISDVHNNKKAFKCKVCNYVTSRKHRLISHMKGHGELFCMHCEYSTTNYEDFQVHLKSCSLQQKAGSLTCSHCNQCFFNRKILADHMLRYHNLELYCCDLCYFTTTDSDEFEAHEQQHFKVDCSATCNKCKVSFDTEKQCEEHILHFHGGEEDNFSFNDACVDIIDENLKCVLCGYQTVHAAVIKNHLDMHTRNMYKCDVLNCLYSAASKKAMKHHVIAEHPDSKQERKSPETKVNKPVIPKVVQPSSSTEEGIYDQDTGGLIGHGSGSWRCAFCPTKPPFRYRRSYEKHVTKHFSNMSTNIATAVGNVLGDIGENKNLPFPENCPICELEFPSRSKLRHHLQTVHETDIVEVCNDNLDKDESGDLWGEGLSQTQKWVNEQKFEVPAGRDDIGGDDDNDSITPEEWTNDNSKRNSDDEDMINDI